MIQTVNFLSTDVLLGIEHFQNGDYLWCAATFSIIFISGYTIAFYSFFKSEEFKNDEKRKSPKTIILHIFLLGPIQHFWKLFNNFFNPAPELEKGDLELR